jgi:hypothetical protein
MIRALLAGGVVLWAHAHVDCRCLRFFKPRFKILSRGVGQRRGEGGEFGISYDDWMDGRFGKF